MYVVGVDVGGTFTDVVVYDTETREWRLTKVPSTPPDFMEGFVEGVTQACASFPNGRLAAIGRVVHGTTVATNAILEQRGARLGILTTQGLEDILIIGRMKRSQMYDLFMEPDEPLFLAPRRAIRGIPERLDAAGQVVHPLDEAAVIEAGRELVERQKVDAVVVCYLHAYLNPAHERRTREILTARYPDLEVSISSDVDPRYREYERLVLTGFDAYVRPVIRHYLAGLQGQMAAAGIRAPLQIMQSRGGINGVWSVLERPEGTILSGPAAGVIGATHVAKLAGFPDSISLDVGGTSADVALCEGGHPVVSTDGHIDRYPLRTPMIDVRTIGAGGGSIAWVDEGGVLKVGPRSAGARPGPACYGRGGTEPAVTDASVVLGYLSPDSFAGGIRLDPELARAAVASKVAEPLGLDLAQAALGIHRIVNANMAQTLRVVSIERGKDPRHFCLVAFGGAGPIHAGRLAEEIGIRTVLVPPAPGVLSALGLLIANVEHEFSRTLRTPAATADLDQVNQALAEVDAVCAERMARDGVAPARCQVHHFAEMRYAGQSYELEVPLETPVTRERLAAAVRAFHESHRRVYAYAKEAAPVEIVTLRAVHASAIAEKATIGQAIALGDPRARTQPPRSRRACFDTAQGYVDVPVIRRESLGPGAELRGPAIVEQPDTTTVIYPGHRTVVDSLGNLVIEVPAPPAGLETPATRVGAATLDPVTLEVLRGRLTTIADEMEMVLLKSSYSPLVKEALDATAAIFDRHGKTIAQAEALPAHLGMLTASVQRIARQYHQGVAKPGDAYILNDPYDGGTHLPDVTVVVPVFDGDILIAYCGTMSHHQDVGGSAPGSTAPNAVDLHAEGIRIPLLKLEDDQLGLNETLMALLLANVRVPISFRGDLEAQVAACRTGARRVHEVCREYGQDVLMAGVDALMEYAERMTRAVIDRIPDGTYEFHDFLDDDGVVPEPIRIQVTITVRGSGIHFDFTGTAPQRRAAINCVPSSTLSAVYFAVRALTGAAVPNNDGCYRPVTVELPRGSIVNPDYPAPVAARAITFKRIVDALLGALAKAVPDRIYAASSGIVNVMYVGGYDPERQARYVGFVGVPMAGGMGARPTKDGIDVVETDLNNTIRYPVEACEAELPLRIRTLRLWRDSGGAGRYRGGLGYEAEVEWLRGDALVTLRQERHKVHPWGLLGGGAAPTCRSVLRRADGRETKLAAKQVIAVRAGDRIRMWIPGGGGYGSPLEREPRAVLDDVLDGRVSRAAARNVYGVVLARRTVDEAATRARRAELRARPPSS
jgi:N-methylhydantoinase A/oxoprolinase/acetone carboxylase beta subunit/N-methylhydantoinase B/oxoprolinase/acetone carboxylase alpha subunit